MRLGNNEAIALVYSPIVLGYHAKNHAFLENPADAVTLPASTLRIFLHHAKGAGVVGRSVVVHSLCINEPMEQYATYSLKRIVQGEAGVVSSPGFQARKRLLFLVRVAFEAVGKNKEGGSPESDEDAEAFGMGESFNRPIPLSEIPNANRSDDG